MRSDSGAALRLTIRADGASRGNPGPASFGAVIFSESGDVLAELYEAIGIATNNHAEYRAVIAALEHVTQHFPSAKLRIELDSNLVVQQLSGNWKIKSADMAELAKRAMELVRRFEVEFAWIPREQNSHADALANRALDLPRLDLATSDVDGVTTVEPTSGLHPVSVSLVQPRSIRAPRVSTAHTDFFLIRHGSTGQTEANRISGGGEDPELSERGVEEAKSVARGVERLAARFHLEFPRRVVHSPLRRTSSTASLLAQHRNLETAADHRLREIEFGDWEGLPNEVLDAMPETLSWRGSITAKPPGGESIADLQARVGEAFFEMVDQHRGETIAVVSHMMPTRTMLAMALGGLDHHFWSLQIQPASISVLRVFGREAFEIYSINSVDHLPH